MKKVSLLNSSVSKRIVDMSLISSVCSQNGLKTVRVLLCKLKSTDVASFSVQLAFEINTISEVEEEMLMYVEAFAYSYHREMFLI
jgi:hypothetical protein